MTLAILISCVFAVSLLVFSVEVWRAPEITEETFVTRFQRPGSPSRSSSKTCRTTICPTKHTSRCVDHRRALKRKTISKSK